MTVNRLASVLEDLAGAVWRTSWQAAVLIGFVLLAQWMFRRQLTPRWRYGLWLIVLARLVWPTFPASPASLFNMAALLTDGRPIPATTALDSPSPPISRVTIERSPMSKLIVDRRLGKQSVAAPAPQTLVMNEYSHQLLRTLTWNSTRILAALWLLGACALLLRTGVATGRLWRHVRLLPPMTQPDVLETFDLCIREARVRRRPRLLIAEANVPPAAGGLLRPYLLIPQDLLSQKDGHALRFILLHELAHLRNGDLFANWVMLVLRALHWFNPAIWFAFGRIRADRELACDAFVLSVTPTREHESYGHVLIDLVERLDGRHLSFETVGISAAPALLKTRIRLISGYNRPRVWQSAVGIVLVLTLGLCGLTSARTAPEKVPSEPEPSATAPAASVAARYAKDLDLPKEITLNVACVAEDGQPIADAEVIVYEIDPWTLESKPAASQRTNSVGTCRFDKVPTADATINRVLRGPGNEVCSVAAKAAGRASAIRYLTTRNVADSAAMVALVMPRAETLSGRVTDANGKPIRGASVYSRGAAWKQPVPGICFAKTDEGGYYEITDIGEWTPPPDAGQTHSQMINEKIGRSWVVPDYFVLYVHHPDYGLKQAECHRVPGVTKIQMEEPGILTGRVVDATTKQPLAGVSLFVEAQPPFKPYGCSWGVTDQNGAYRIAVAAKSDYYLFVSKDGFVPTKRSPRPTAIPANVATPVEDIEMVRTGTIRGHVVDRITKKPIRLSTKPAVNFVVRSSRDTPWGSEPFTTRIGSDGAFEQRAVHPSRTYSLSVESDDPTIKSQANIVETPVGPGETVEMDLPVTLNNSNR